MTAQIRLLLRTAKGRQNKKQEGRREPSPTWKALLWRRLYAGEKLPQNKLLALALSEWGDQPKTALERCYPGRTGEVA